MDKKKKAIAITTIAVGSIMLVVGVMFLVLKFVGGPKVADGDYLVSSGQWTLESNGDCDKQVNANEGEEVSDCGSRVIWDFTEIGKGTLTTNNHQNDYEFQWAIEDDKLTIKTNWLYELNNEYDYKLDQSAGVLTLTAGQQEYTFTSKQ